jgi:hypothetical protein
MRDDDRADQPPDAVAALIEKTAVAMAAPFQTAAELRADAKHFTAGMVRGVAMTGRVI